MPMIHGKTGALLINAKDVSPYTNKIDFEQTADDHDTTTFGNTGHTYMGGLTDGTVKLSGLYDNTAMVGPRASVKASLGAVVAFKYQPEGIGTGLPESTCNVLVKSYKESVPVDDMVTWEADLSISGEVTDGTQV